VTEKTTEKGIGLPKIYLFHKKPIILEQFLAESPWKKTLTPKIN
jgi:hypothetical protein